MQIKSCIRIVWGACGCCPPPRPAAPSPAPSRWKVHFGRRAGSQRGQAEVLAAGKEEAGGGPCPSARPAAPSPALTRGKLAAQFGGNQGSQLGQLGVTIGQIPPNWVKGNSQNLGEISGFYRSNPGLGEWFSCLRPGAGRDTRTAYHAAFSVKNARGPRRSQTAPPRPAACPGASGSPEAGGRPRPTPQAQRVADEDLVVLDADTGKFSTLGGSPRHAGRGSAQRPEGRGGRTRAGALQGRQGAVLPRPRPAAWGSLPPGAEAPALRASGTDVHADLAGIP